MIEGYLAGEFYVDLDDAPAGESKSQALRNKLAAAERDKDDPGELVSKDGCVQMMIVHTGFSTGDVDRDRVLIAKLGEFGSEIRRALPDVEFGVAGDAAVSLAVEALDDEQRAELDRLRPPERIPPVGDFDVPEGLAWPFIESDGTRGRLILATAGRGYEVWDTRDTVRFASNARALELPDDVHFGGAAFVFADVIDGVMRDGPRATLAAGLGAILVVALIIGLNRFGLVTIVCGVSGTVIMLVVSAIVGLKVNFLDFVALPITIGIGIDYAVNIVARARQDGIIGGVRSSRRPAPRSFCARIRPQWATAPCCCRRTSAFARLGSLRCWGKSRVSSWHCISRQRCCGYSAPVHSVARRGSAPHGRRTVRGLDMAAV